MDFSRPCSILPRVLAALAVTLLTVNVCHAGRTTTTYTMTYAGSLVARSALLLLRAGDTVSVAATGLIDSNQHDHDNPWNGPEGLNAFHPAAPIPSARHNSLIAYIGPDHTPIPVGANGTFIAPHDGELKFGANDHFPQDNQGSWTITYSVTAASSQTISISPLPDPAIVGATHVLNAVASPSSLPVTLEAWDGCTVDQQGVVSFTRIGPCLIIATQAGDFDHLPAPPHEFQTTVVRKPQTVNFTSTPPTGAVIGSRYRPEAVATSGGEVIFNTNGDCSFTDNDEVVFLGMGVCEISAYQDGDRTEWQPSAEAFQRISVGEGRSSQTITFSSTPPSDPKPGSSYSPSATTSSGLPVSFIVTGDCTLAAQTVILQKTGTCTVTATQSGDARYEAAEPKHQTITIGRTSATLELTAAPPSAREGEPITLTATLPLPSIGGRVSFTHDDRGLCTDTPVSSGTASCHVSFEAAGRYTVSATYSGDNSHTPATAPPVAILVTAQKTSLNVKAATSFLRHRNNMLLSSDTIGSRPAETLHLHQARLPFTSEPPTAHSPALNAFLGSQSIGLQRLNFSASLNDLRLVAQERDARHTQAAREALGFADQWQTMTQPAPSKHNVWINTQYTTFTHSDHEPTDNTAAIVATGFDYVISPALLVGVFIQGDAMRSETGKTRVEGYGGLIGPYLAAALAPNLVWQAQAGWGLSTNTLEGEGSAHTFTSERWMAMTSLSGRYQLGNWSVNPEARIAYISDTAERTSVLPELRNTMGQVKSGPRISYRHVDKSGATFEPFAGLRVTWTFADDTSTDGIVLSIDESFGPSGIRGEAEFGFNAIYPDGLSWEIRGAYDGIGSDNFSAVNGSALISIPF